MTTQQPAAMAPMRGFRTHTGTMREESDPTLSSLNEHQAPLLTSMSTRALREDIISGGGPH